VIDQVRLTELEGACTALFALWDMGTAFGNAFDGALDTVESTVHELAHWYSLGHRARPRSVMYTSIASSLDRMAVAWRDVEEARAMAIELRALELLGVDLSDKQRNDLIRYAAAGMSRGSGLGQRLVREYADDGKSRREIERLARRVARVVREHIGIEVDEELR